MRAEFFIARRLSSSLSELDLMNYLNFYRLSYRATSGYFLCLLDF